MRDFSISEIIGLFSEEFSFVRKKFYVYDVRVVDAQDEQSEGIWRPGVYVFWRDNKVYRVGSSVINSRKRALQHIPADTGGKLKELGVDPLACLVLFNVKDEADVNWVPALEIFFERTLNPIVPSGRRG